MTMGAGVILWVRAGHKDSEDALAFLKSNRYAADEVRDLARSPPTPEERRALVVGLGGDEAALMDPKDPASLRAPILLTRRGALAGFRESKWRAFLDIGKGRA
jgi:hypothetical protein